MVSLHLTVTRSASPDPSPPTRARPSRRAPPPVEPPVEEETPKNRSGRHVQDWERSTEKLTLRLRPEVVKDIRAMAEKEGRHLAEIVTDGIALKKGEKAAAPRRKIS